MAKAPEISTKHSSPLLGILPYIGVILFIISILPILFGNHTGDWQRQVVLNGVIYMVGWAGIGSGISHLFFGKQISKSIGFEKSPYELEVGFCGLSFGIVGVIAASYQPDFWLAVILMSSLYRIGCGYGHVRQILQKRNFAINNTAILVLDFGVPAFLLWSYCSWIG